MRRVPPPVVNQLALELEAYGQGGSGGDVTQAEFDALQLQVNNLSNEVDGIANNVSDLQDQTNDLQNQINNLGTGNLGRDYFTLSALDISNKYITLSHVPAVPAEVDVYIYTGINQQVGVDFIINGNQLNWDGLAMELLVSVNSRIFVTYAI